MFSHFTLGTNDLDRALSFYNGVMGAHGQALVYEDIDVGYLMYTPPDKSYPHLFICRPVDGLPGIIVLYISLGRRMKFNVRATSCHWFTASAHFDCYDY